MKRGYFVLVILMFGFVLMSASGSSISTQDDTVTQTESMSDTPWQENLIVTGICVLAIGYLAFRYCRLEKEYQKTQERLTQMNKVLSELEQQVVAFNCQIKKLEDFQKPEVGKRIEQPANTDIPSVITPSVEESPVPVLQLVSKYCSFLIDEKGAVKTEQRILTDDDSYHWFRICYEEGSDRATYTINLRRRDAILSDLQTFQNYTEPFVLTGMPSDIKVTRQGILRREGKTWVVTQKVKVTFIY